MGLYLGHKMTTYNIREFKARASEILRNLNDDEEVIITRHGKPCGKLTAIRPSTESKPPLSRLRGTLTQLPEAEYQDFLDVKTEWERDLTVSALAQGDSAKQ